MDHLDPKQNWGAEAFRKPPIPEGATELFSECGRILKLEGRSDGVDYRSHWFVMYQDGRHGKVMLAVRHGGGDRTVSLGYDHLAQDQIATLLPSDLRYLYFHGLYDLHQQGHASGHSDAKHEYRQAFAEGRLKKRKLPKSNLFKIWVEHPSIIIPEKAFT